MDIDNFLTSLDSDYKEFLTATAFTFPISYFDCWKLSVLFRTFDMLPQIILSVAISIIFLSTGTVFSIWTIKAAGMSGKSQIADRLKVPLISITFVLTSAFVLTGIVRTPKEFGIIYLIFSLVVIFDMYLSRKLREK